MIGLLGRATRVTDGDRGSCCQQRESGQDEDADFRTSQAAEQQRAAYRMVSEQMIADHVAAITDTVEE